jgi:hypothetical protein
MDTEGAKMMPKRNDSQKWMFPWAGRKSLVSMAVLLMVGGLGLMAVLFWGSAPALAQEYIGDQEPVPDSVDQVVTPMELAYKEPPTIPRFFPWLKEKLKDTPPFFRDTKFDINIRTYYFNREQYDNNENEAWALEVSFVQVRLVPGSLRRGRCALYLLACYAPDDKDGTLLLKPVRRVHGRGSALWKSKLVEDNFINIYRYEYNTPFINKNDNRMTPNTFEGYTFNGAYGGKDDAPRFSYGGGYITKIKERNSDRFVWMSQDAADETGSHLGGGRVSTRASRWRIDYFQMTSSTFYTNPIMFPRRTGSASLRGPVPRTSEVREDLLQGFLQTNQFGIKGRLWRGNLHFLTTDSKEWTSEPLERLSRLYQRAGAGFQPGRRGCLYCEGLL